MARKKQAKETDENEWVKSFYRLFPDNPHRRISPQSLCPCMRRTFAELTFGIEIELDKLGVDGGSATLKKFFDGCKYDHRLATFRVEDYHGRVWKVTRDTSIGEAGFEIVSPVLGYRDLTIVREIVRRFREAGAEATEKTGIHIHIGVSDWNPSEVMSAFMLYANYEANLLRTLNVRPKRLTYCEPIRPFAERAYKEIERKRDGATRKTYQQIMEETWYVDADGNPLKKKDRKKSRYRQVNLHRYLTTLKKPENTLEFRTFNSIDDTRVIAAYVLFILSAMSFAKHLPDVPILLQEKIDLPDFFRKTKDMMTNYIRLDAASYKLVRECFEQLRKGATSKNKNKKKPKALQKK